MQSFSLEVACVTSTRVSLVGNPDTRVQRLCLQGVTAGGQEKSKTEPDVAEITRESNTLGLR